MTENTLHIWPEVGAVIAGMLVLFIFAVAISIRQQVKVKPGSRGHRSQEQEGEHEEIRPDGYIDSFAGVIEEAGGGLTPLVKIALPGIILWFLLYLIWNWTPR